MDNKLSTCLLWLLCSAGACLPKDSTTVYCVSDRECQTITPGLRCDVSRHVCACEGSPPACGQALDAGGSDSLPLPLDASPPDVPIGAADAPALDLAVGGSLEPAPDGALDQALPDLALPAIDTRVPDAAGTCALSGDCPDPTRAFCVAGLCLGCGLAGPGACASPTPVCDEFSGACVGCTADGHCASAAAPICDLNRRACAACTLDLQCQGKSANLPACRADGQCVECTATAAKACGGATPVCDPKTNRCVACVTDADCGGATPLCGSDNRCHGCASDSDCAILGDAHRAACAGSGACVECTGTNAKACAGATSVCHPTSNQCVACVSNATCSGTAPVCATATSTCRACSAPSDCTSFAGRTACAGSGACVECTDNGTCAGGQPICQTSAGGSAPQNTCRACASDGECAGVGPGVCMKDGHCAADAEAIYVGSAGTATCSSANPGTTVAPVCSLAAGVGLAKSGGKPVVIVRGALAPASTTIAVNSPLTIVGKNGAIIIPADPGADCITLTQGEVFLRSLAIQGSLSPASGMGINAAPPSGATVTLHMDTCAVRNHPGGGLLLNGAAFDLRDVLVSGNGPGTVLATGLTWGGVYVQSLPASGPSSFALVSIENNNGGGLTCSGAVQASGLLVTLNTNTVSQIGSLCGITTGACPAAGATCGAQSQPQ